MSIPRTPTTVEVTFTDDTKARTKLPVETWLSNGTYSWTLEKRPTASVVIDPDHQLPDDDRSNNEKKTQ